MYEELATIHTILYRLCCRDIDHVVCSSKCLEALAFLHDNVGIDFFVQVWPSGVMDVHCRQHACHEFPLSCDCLASVLL